MVDRNSCFLNACHMPHIYIRYSTSSWAHPHRVGLNPFYKLNNWSSQTLGNMLVVTKLINQNESLVQVYRVPDASLGPVITTTWVEKGNQMWSSVVKGLNFAAKLPGSESRLSNFYSFTCERVIWEKASLGLLWRLCELIFIKCFEHCLTHNQHCVTVSKLKNTRKLFSRKCFLKQSVLRWCKVFWLYLLGYDELTLLWSQYDSVCQSHVISWHGQWEAATHSALSPVLQSSENCQRPAMRGHKIKLQGSNVQNEETLLREYGCPIFRHSAWSLCHQPTSHCVKIAFNFYRQL